MDQEEKKSRSQVKREMHDLEKLGQRLVAMPQHQIDKMDLPGELADAILFARTITSHGARKRHLKYIGGIMRRIDVEPILMAVARIDGDHSAEVQYFQDLEQLRERLMEEAGGAMDEVMVRFPDVDRQHIMQLVRNARKERDIGKPPKAYRALFAYLRELSEG